MLGFDFFLKVVIISISGALSPGPLTAAILVAGTKRGWKAGFMASVGHMIVEFPLILIIGLGFALLLTNRLVILIISIIGSLFLLLLGILMIIDGLRKSSDKSILFEEQTPLLIGSLLSAFNPYFLLWWFFIGGVLIIEAVAIMGLIGLIILFLYHIWLDYAWLTLISHLAFRGKNLLKTKGYRIFLITMGVVISGFGINLLLSAI